MWAWRTSAPDVFIYKGILGAVLWIGVLCQFISLLLHHHYCYLSFCAGLCYAVLVVLCCAELCFMLC
jgi:hypothetical protein